MPNCFKCGEEIQRGLYCSVCRVDTGSTLGIVIDDDRPPRRDRGGDDRSGDDDLRIDSDRGVYRGE